MNEFADTLQWKLWMYFYIKDIPWEEDATYAKVLQLEKQLQNNGLETVFASKNEARAFLERRIPDILDRFDEYNIDNPLPATLYVMLTNDQDYSILKEYIPRYADVIVNIEALNEWRTLQDQEWRVLKAITFSNFLISWSYFLIAIFIIIIVVILMFLLRNKFILYQQKVELKKMLGASYNQIKLPFIITSGAISVLGFAIMLVLFFWLDSYVGSQDFSLIYMIDILSQEYIPDKMTSLFSQGIRFFVVQFILLLLLVSVIGELYLGKLIRTQDG